MKKIIIFQLIFISMILTTLANPTIFTVKASDHEITTLTDSESNGSVSILLDIPDEIKEWIAPDGTFPNAVNAFLVKINGYKILIDAGLGNKLVENLAAAGTRPEDIDYILLTHMHGDHIGGLIQNGQRVFPNATLIIPVNEYDYWNNDSIMNCMPERSKNSFKNAQSITKIYHGDFKLICKDPAENGMISILDGIIAMDAPGHTPGHTLYLIGSGADKTMVWGDLTHALPFQMPYPEIAVTYDVDPATAIASRLKTLLFLNDKNYRVAGMHIPFPGIGKIESQDRGYRFNPCE